MGLKIFHTGDIHLGMKFNNYRSGIKEKLVEARFSALERMIEKSNDLNSDLFVIAGDLFNTIQVLKKDIKRCVNILDKFNGACVLVLPGNHDYDNGMTDLWIDFSKEAGEKILLLNEKRYYPLSDYDIDAIVYPAPCHSKHSKENSLGWIKEEGLCHKGKYHIGIAHGAIEGLSADIEGNYYLMGKEELMDIPTDLWLLGHTHVSYPEKQEIKNHKIFNPGTPEPDGMDFSGEGAAWYIEIDEKNISAQRISIGEFRFFDIKFQLKSDIDLDTIYSWMQENGSEKAVVRINLTGNISKEAYSDLNSFYKSLEAKVFHLIIEDSDLKIKINQEIIEKEFTKGSFPYEFLNELSHDQEALQIAYDLLRGE